MTRVKFEKFFLKDEEKLLEAWSNLCHSLFLLSISCSLVQAENTCSFSKEDSLKSPQSLSSVRQAYQIKGLQVTEEFYVSYFPFCSWASDLKEFCLFPLYTYYAMVEWEPENYYLEKCTIHINHCPTEANKLFCAAVVLSLLHRGVLLQLDLAAHGSAPRK